MADDRARSTSMPRSRTTSSLAERSPVAACPGVVAAEVHPVVATTLGPVDHPDAPVYLRTAVSVGQEGWANFDYVTCPSTGGASSSPSRSRIARSRSATTRVNRCGRRYRESIAPSCVASWSYRATRSRRRSSSSGSSCQTAPSLYDMRNLFQINVEEGRHLWAMVYLLHRYFGRDGRDEADEMLERHSGDADQPTHPRGVQRTHSRLAVVLHVHVLHRSRRQVPAGLAARVSLRPVVAHVRLHVEGGGPSHVRGRRPASVESSNEPCS